MPSPDPPSPPTPFNETPNGPRLTMGRACPRPAWSSSPCPAAPPSAARLASPWLRFVARVTAACFLTTQTTAVAGPHEEGIAAGRAANPVARAGFADARLDNGIATTLRVSQVPAVYLAQPFTGKISPIGFGVLSEAQLLERISIVAATGPDAQSASVHAAGLRASTPTQQARP